MLEKIGLPPKPSLRGNTWVVDASHCQGCSSQFTFINRKHHCRRCGGIFCNSCTQQRMLLRGQGDSPVRICDACKSLEEAARFERYGHKSRAARGSSKLASKREDDILNQVLGNQDKSASCSNITEEVEGVDISRNLSLDHASNTLTEVEYSTPEELREQATLEKKKYKTLKAEGKPEEALRAFKRGKELERQAAALEISLRKNRKKASSFSNNSDDSSQMIEDVKAKSILYGQKSKAKEDIFAELKELGWSDMDVEKQPANLSLEGELSSLLKEVAQKPNKENKAISSDKSQVIAIKKRALELKRSGNLIEAKEELKRAKILERKIEEEELLGEGDDSDDELSSLIRNMDEDEHDDLSAINKSDFNFSFDNFGGISDDLAVDGNFEVTDEDMDDPEIASALKSLGWTEEHHEQVKPVKSESLRTEIQSLKREALSQKRAGNSAEAMSLLRKAKLLEVELESSENGSDLMDMGSGMGQKGPNPHAAEERFLNVNNGPKLAPKNKLTIQRELIALKKKALTLRREGKLDESEEELKKAKILEQQLEDMNKTSSIAEPSYVNKQAFNNTNATLVDDDENEEEVTDQDLHDPNYLSLLKNLGWEEEENAKNPSVLLKENDAISNHNSVPFITESVSNVKKETSRKSKSEIQRELLALKRKALTLRRQGEGDEADEVLKMAKLLETQLQEYEEPVQREAPAVIDEESEIRIQDSVKQEKIELEKPEQIVQEIAKPYIHESSTASSSLQQEILAHKRKAVSLKREGKLAEAKEELRQAKLLEKENSQNSTKSSDASSSDVPSVVEKKEASPSSVSKPMSSRDKFKLQQQCLGHKRESLKLRREGKTAEADAEFELAKALESQLQELDSQDSSKNAEQGDDVMIEDFLDPQLLSALQSIGLGDVQTQTHVTEKPEPIKSDIIDDSEMEREKLVERIKAEKIKAVNLKRSGKQGEALDALRRAKLYEKKLQSLTSV